MNRGLYARRRLTSRVFLTLSVLAAGFGIGSLALIRVLRDDLRRFLASAAFIAGMLTSAAAGVFPYVLPSVSEANPGLTVFNSAPAQYGLKIGLAWWIPGLLLAAGYVAFVSALLIIS